MARIRTIKPEFPQSETIGRLSREARLLFVQLWTVADDAGRARASSRVLASLLYPFDDDAKDLIDEWLCELVSNDCLFFYEADGNRYLQITNWLKHQKIDRPSASRIPAPEDGIRETLASPREPSMQDLGPRTVDHGPRKDNSLVISPAKSEPISLPVPSEAGDGDVIVISRKKKSEAETALLQCVGEAWNELADSLRLPQIGKLTDKRKSWVIARAKELVADYDFENPVDGFSALFEKIKSSKFLRGEANGFRCNFDFAFNQSSFTKIMEGAYENR